MGMRALFCQIWNFVANVLAVSFIALGLSYAMISFFTVEGPVLQTKDVTLHTPVVAVGGVLSYSLWRVSHESCPGTVVTSFTRADDVTTDKYEQDVVFTIRRALSTPGFNSPPRLNINTQLPNYLVPAKWHVRVGIDSECPARRRFDVTAEFDIEVVNGAPKGNR